MISTKSLPFEHGSSSTRRNNLDIDADLGVNIKGLLDEEGGHLLGAISVGQVGRGGDSEFTVASKASIVGPFEGAHAAVGVVTSDELVLAVNIVRGFHG